MEYDKKILIFEYILLKYLTICQIYDNFANGTLELSGSSILDIADYLNLSLLITSSGNIYNATPISPLTYTGASLNASSAAAVCNEKYILVACLQDSLLTKININNGTFQNLIDYSAFGSIIVSNRSSCCLSIYENIVSISISQPYLDNKIKNAVFTVNIKNKDDIINGPIIDTDRDNKICIFPFEYNKTGTTRDISCEFIVEKISNSYRLLCSYEDIEPVNKIVYLASLNSSMDNLEKIKIIPEKGIEHGFRLYKIDNYYLRLVLRDKLYDVYLDSNFDIQIEKKSNFVKFESIMKLFSYNNNFVMTYIIGFCYKNVNITSQTSILGLYTFSTDYYSIFLYAHTWEPHTKLYNYYNDILDYHLLLYQSATSIRYIIFQNNKEIFNINSFSFIYRVKSNDEIDFNVSSLIQSTTNFGKLYIEQSKIISSSNKSEIITYKYPFDTLDFPIDKENQKITLKANQSFWYEFDFALEDRSDSFLKMFSFPNAKLSIRICAFQCGSCLTDYYICDTCRDDNYAKKINSEDSNCYPVTQTLEKYIYNSESKSFEECYISCKFCSKMNSESSNTEHNCLICDDEYIPSYEHPGNCYKNENNNNGKYITINSVSDQSFTSIDLCPSEKNYVINSTKECVTECPESITLYSYKYTFVNFTELEYDMILKDQYTFTETNKTIYTLGKFCFEECPANSENIEMTNECKYINAWHKDPNNGEITCYEEDYCKYDGHKYYLSDTKECTESCPSGYYQFYFQCYPVSSGCPSDTILNGNNCESNFEYCYINEYYQNECSNEKNNEYKYNFNNTKQFLKNCEESLNYTIFQNKTYLYNGTCYLNCPENTNKNEDNDICDCLYFGYYSEEDETNYICYNEEEKCRDKIPVIDKKICLDSINNCISKGYKVFNKECYSEECPKNSEIKNIGDYNCLCKYYFYNNDSNLICYNSIVTSCEDKHHEYSNPDTLECFNSLEDCLNKNNSYFFNRNCYKDSCPSQYISLSNITNEIIKNDFITNLNINEEYINRICVCDIIHKNISWNYTIINDIYLQNCLEYCPIEYEPNKISNRCIESCLEYKHYMFNNECFYESCPNGTHLKEVDGHICVCSNYFYNDKNKSICYNSQEECISNDLIYYNEDNKQCFSSLDDCFFNNYNYFFNKICYKDGCPSGTILLNNISNITIKNQFIEFLDIDINLDLIDKICVCDIINNNNLKWNFNKRNNEQECLSICDENIYESEPDPITHKCIEKCNPLSDYVFNDKCFKYNCPEGTHLKNDGTRNCICEQSYYIDEENGKMVCCNDENKDDINCIENIVYPPEYYENPDKCLAVYNNTCYSKCPEGTCLTQKDINLVYCVKIKSYITVINDICFNNFKNISNYIKYIADNDLYIYTSPIILIKGYTKYIEVDINKNYSIVYLNECEDLLKEYYNLSQDTILYILGVESPSKNKTKLTNTYNYGVYLENGTQLNISICDGEEIKLYSPIINNSLINFDEAKYFYLYGNYNIYDENDNFYTDICSPASINGNDITLSDRYKDFYISNISLCNNTCTFYMVNFDIEKIECTCKIIVNYSYIENIEDNSNTEEDNYTFLDYILSFINYKIVICFALLLDYFNYLGNLGIYIGFSINVICIAQMIINLTYGRRFLYQILKENIPSKAKLEEKARKINEKEKCLTNVKGLINNSIYKKHRNRIVKRKEKKFKIYKNNEPSKKKYHKFSEQIQKKLKLDYEKNKKQNSSKSLKEKILTEQNTSNNKIFAKEKEMLEIHKKNNECHSSKHNIYKRCLNNGLTNLPKNHLFKKRNKIRFRNKEKSETNIYNIIYADDDSIDKKDLNDVPYSQALRIDNRGVWEIFLYTFANKIEIINIFFYRNIYVHLSMTLSIYLFSLFLDITMNCFLYSDDVVSEKYHNNGRLNVFTSLSLSIASNIISSIITFYMKKLGEYSDFLEILIRDITNVKYYYINLIKFRKYFKVKLSLFYFIQFLMNILMTYYITIFCIIYSKTKVSFMINYFYGVAESFAISLELSIIITIMRYIGLKYKCIKLYRTSQFLNNYL